jgi:hypothetical protein
VPPPRTLPLPRTRRARGQRRSVSCTDTWPTPMIDEECCCSPLVSSCCRSSEWCRYTHWGNAWPGSRCTRREMTSPRRWHNRRVHPPPSCCPGSFRSPAGMPTPCSSTPGTARCTQASTSGRTRTGFTGCRCGDRSARCSTISHPASNATPRWRCACPNGRDISRTSKTISWYGNRCPERCRPHSETSS